MGSIPLDQITLDKIAINQIPARRKQIRKQRRQLSKRQLRQAETAVVHKLINVAEIKKAIRIGLYLSDFGEVPTQALIQKLIQQPDADCEKVLQQMTAARRALDKAFFEMLACVIESNVLDEQQGDAAQRMSEVKELLTRYA